MRRCLKILAVVMAAPLLLLLLAGIFIYIPPVQDWFVNRVAQVATEGTGLRVRVDRVGLSFPLDLDVRNIVATDDKADTLLSVRRIVVDLDFSDILKGNIGIEELAMHDAIVSTKDFITGLEVGGRLGHFRITMPNEVRLRESKAEISGISLTDCDLFIRLGEMEQSADTTASAPLPWSIDVDNVDIDDVHVKAVLGDTMAIETRLDRANANTIKACLSDGFYSVTDFSSAFDYIIVDNLSLPSVTAAITDIALDTTRIHLQEARVGMSQSWLKVVADAEWSSIDVSRPEGMFDVTVNGFVANTDLTALCNRFGLDLMRYNKEASVTLSMQAEGNMRRIEMRDAELIWDKVLKLDLFANAKHPFDNTLRADARMHLQSFAGEATLDARYDNAQEAYSVLLDIVRLHPDMIVGGLPVQCISTNAKVDGKGFDVFAPETCINIDANVTQCMVDSLDFNDITLIASLADRRAYAMLESNNPLLQAAAQCDAILGKRGVTSTFSIDLAKADLQGMHVVDSALSVGCCLHVDATTNMKDRHRVTGHLNDILLMRPDTVLRPVDLNLDVMMRPDSLYAHFAAGSMLITASTSGGIEQVMGQIDAFKAELENQAKTHFIDQNVMKPLLPTADVHLRINGRNPISTWLGMMGYTFKDLRFDLNSDPTIGLNGGGYILAMSNGSILLDTLQWHIFQDTTGVKLDTRLRNGPKNKQFVFDARLNAYILGDGAGVNVTYTDGKGKRGVDFGAVANLTRHGVHVHLTPLKPIIAYRGFTLNDDNYVLLGRSGHLFANVDLLADDGTGLQLYSAEQFSDSLHLDSLPGALQDITASFRKVNLGELSSVMPYLPILGGYLEGDVHYIQEDTTTMAVAMDAHINKFVYEGAPVGKIGLNATYLPGDDGSHFVDGIVSLNDADCAVFTGTYIDDGADGHIDVDADLTALPLSVANGFVDKNLAQLSGVLDGCIKVKGKPSSPIVNGGVMTRGLTVHSNNYSLLLRVQDDSIKVVDNYLDFDRIDVYSTGKNPLTMDGWVDFRDLERITVNLTFKGNNFELINAKKTTTSLAYGKVYCDVDARVNGTLDNIYLGGTLGVLGNTDVTYILKDSPLTVEDQLSDLVTFVDFSSDDVPEEKEPVSEMDITMNIKLRIDDAAQVHCLLSEDKSSYVDIEGGGELSMTYLPQGDIQLTGRYTINSGEMKYQLPVIPLKTFKIENGSYVSFSGAMLNPTLNLVAKERMRALVSQEGGASRNVAFDVGVKITQTLENMGLQFTIEAPEDATVQNELETMDEATRGRIAVTMLATGMYLSDNNSGAFSTENALNSFLQSEISNIAGKALGSVDLSFGMENSTSASGASQTDYSFRFAKHFWGNRISVVLGGTVSSGSEAENTGATLIDNVSIEYRLDQSATRYVRVFYDKTYESLIDGKLTEMGAGLVLRRKTTNLGDLFIFRRKKS